MPASISLVTCRYCSAHERLSICFRRRSDTPIDGGPEESFLVSRQRSAMEMLPHTPCHVPLGRHDPGVLRPESNGDEAMEWRLGGLLLASPSVSLVPLPLDTPPSVGGLTSTHTTP